MTDVPIPGLGERVRRAYVRKLVHFPADDGQTVCGMADPYTFTAYDHVVTCPQCKTYQTEREREAQADA